MFEALMSKAAARPRLASFLVVAAVIGFAFWEPLFAGATLAPLDLIEGVAHPQRAYREFGAVPDRASGDLVNIHAHWASFGRIVRDLDGWWDPSVAQGYPIMKGGLPVFAVTYVVFPAWFAAGAMTIARTVFAWAFTALWLRCFDLRRSSALVAGFAYAFSGFLVGWGGWPHANVAAFAPMLLWGIERLIDDRSLRRGVPLGVAIAGMVWSNSPLVTAYLLIGVAIYTVIRLAVADGRDAVALVGRRLPAAGVGVLVAAGLSYPHLRFFAEWLNTVDTSHREFSTDSAAGIDFLLTSVLPGAFGSNGHGPAYFAAGNWIEFQTFVGISVLLVAAFAPALAFGSSAMARRRRGAIAGLWVMVLAGVLIAYVGGPVTGAAQAVMGDVSGLATRAKLLISLGFAGLVGFGFDAWISPSPEIAAARRRILGWVRAGGLALAILFVPAVVSAADLAEQAGARREIIVIAIPHVLAALVGLGVLVAAQRRWIRPAAVAMLLAVTISAELLWFARPVPTVFDADEVFEPLAEHELVLAELGPGERLGGSYQSFYPAATQAFDIATLGGQTLKSDGYQALMRAVDPLIFDAAEFGHPAYPSVPPRISPALSVWDVLGVGIWSSAPSHAPVGPRTEPPPSFAMDDVAREAITGTMVVPDGGLRAVVVDALITPSPGRIELVVEVGDQRIETWMPHNEVWPGERHGLAVPLAGEGLPAGEMATVTLSSSGEPQAFLAGVTLQGELELGSIAGADDGLEVFSTGAVTMMRRHDVAPFRIHDAAITEADVDAAARLVVDRPAVAGAAAVVGASVDLPAVPDPAAELELLTSTVDRSRVSATVRTDRPAIVVVPVPDYPGWEAIVNGAPAEIVTVDTALVGVVVPEGVSDIEVAFTPGGLRAALAVFGVTALASVALWFRGSGAIRRREDRAPAVEVP